MSSVIVPVNGDVVTVHVEKHLISNPGAVWSNTYDFKIVDAASGTLLTDMYTTCLAFERAITLNTVHFDEVRISTFLADSHPYNPEAFVTFPVDALGTVSGGGDPLPLGYAWLILRNTTAGRPGKLFIRAGNGESDVISSGGLPVFSTPADMSARLAAAITSSGLTNCLAGVGAESNLVVAHYDKVTHVTTTRFVQNLTSRGPILAKLSRKRRHRIVVHS